MSATWEIARKDMRLRVRDKSLFIWGLLAPLGLAFIFNLVFGPAFEEDFEPSQFALVDQDGGPVAASFSQLLSELQAQGLLEIENMDEEAARTAIEEDELESYFLIPAGFSAAVTSGQEATIEVVGNVDTPTSSQIAGSIASRFGEGVDTVRLSIATTQSGPGGPYDPQTVAAAAQTAAADPPVALAQEPVSERQLDPTSFFVAGMAGFFVFFTIQAGVTSLLEEREEGTLARLQAAPIARSSILAGKALNSFLLGFFSMAVLMVASHYLMGSDLGPPFPVAVLAAALVASAVGIMGLIASVAKNAEQAGNLQSAVAVILGMLGGTFFPVGGTGLLSKLTYISPHAWWMRGLNDLAGGGGIEVVLPSVAVLLFMALVTGGMAVFILRRKEQW
jgi:ABC-2 type transport system permease protein